MPGSPTTRSLAQLRKDGWTAEVVEKFNSFTKTRHDLFNIADIIAIRGRAPGQAATVRLVQTTTGDNVAARVTKIANAPLIGIIREAGIEVHVHGWRKNSTGRWELRVVDCS